MSTLSKPNLSPQQYLELERQAERKSEYYRGEMFPMSGARWAHNIAAANAIRELGTQLLGGPCEVCAGNLRVKVGDTGLYTYPDIVVVCGEPHFVDNTLDTLVNPKLLVEILSESTEAYDRVTKLEFYRSIESLSEYLMISSLRMFVDCYTRQPDGAWIYNAKTAPEDSIELKSVNCRLRLTDLYRKVEFGQTSPNLTGR